MFIYLRVCLFGFLQELDVVPIYTQHASVVCFVVRLLIYLRVCLFAFLQELDVVLPRSGGVWLKGEPNHARWRYWRLPSRRSGWACCCEETEPCTSARMHACILV
jgi:hypothetical protein